MTGLPVAAAIIVLHWGGYVGGTPAYTAPAAASFAAQGLHVENADYPLGDLDAAARYVHRTAAHLHKRYGRVYAYGESAGGGLAALAAARGWVDAAVANSPTIDLARWRALPLRASAATRRRNSAATYVGRRSAPLWTIVGAADDVVPPAPTVAAMRRWHNGRLTVVAGGRHVACFTAYRRAAAFLTR